MKMDLQTDFLSLYDSLKHKNVTDYFELLIDSLYLYFLNLWKNSSDTLDNISFNQYSAVEKKYNKDVTETFLNTFTALFQQLDVDPQNQSKVNEIKMESMNYINSSEFFNEKISKDYPYDFIKSTKYFVSNAMKFDENLDFYDIFQALRNVWTMNMLQTICGKEVKLTYPIFGYSMLYPYTDNFLDSPQITFDEKNFLSKRLKRRLSGQLLMPLNNYEDKVFQLITLIEDTYPRHISYALYKSLLSIHHFQTKSLKQFSKNSRVDISEIMQITVKKGGLSVLTDAYLIKGELDLQEIIISFGLGVILQLVDDLQDIKADAKEGNRTIFTITKQNESLDKVTCKLINFISAVIDILPKSNILYSNNIQKALKTNCILMLLFSISRSSGMYSKEFTNCIQHYFPFPPSYMRNFNSNIKNKCSKLKQLDNIGIIEVFNVLLKQK